MYLEQIEQDEDVRRLNVSREQIVAVLAALTALTPETELVKATRTLTLNLTDAQQDTLSAFFEDTEEFGRQSTYVFDVSDAGDLSVDGVYLHRDGEWATFPESERG